MKIVNSVTAPEAVPSHTVWIDENYYLGDASERHEHGNAPTAGENHGFENFMDSVDGLVMGRHTYEKVLAFDQWPYRKPVVVLSKSLRQDRVPAKLSGKVHLSADTPQALMESLYRRGWKRVYVDGGQVIQSFLTAGLIEDLIITRIPVLLGSGRPLFGPLPNTFRKSSTRSQPAVLTRPI